MIQNQLKFKCNVSRIWITSHWTSSKQIVSNDYSSKTCTVYLVLFWCLSSYNVFNKQLRVSYQGALKHVFREPWAWIALCFQEVPFYYLHSFTNTTTGKQRFQKIGMLYACLASIDIICTGVRPASTVQSYKVSEISQKSWMLFILYWETKWFHALLL